MNKFLIILLMVSGTLNLSWAEQIKVRGASGQLAFRMAGTHCLRKLLNRTAFRMKLFCHQHLLNANTLHHFCFLKKCRKLYGKMQETSGLK